MHRCIASLLLMVSVGSLFADDTPAAAVTSADPAPFEEVASAAWVNVDYLHWWVRGAPQPFPLVTSGSVNDFRQGALGLSATQILYGGQAQDFGAFSGLRLRAGTWLDDEQLFGVEVGGFLLERQSAGFAANSDNGGSPQLSLPLFNVSSGQEGMFIVATPDLLPPGGGVLIGSVQIANTLRLWGTEVVGLANISRGENLSFSLIGGFRHLNLSENLLIRTRSDDVIPQRSFYSEDQFSTRNRLYALQIGSRTTYHQGLFDVELNTRLNLGVMNQTVRINGLTALSGPGALPDAGTFPGGVFALPSNIGEQATTRFAIAPEVGIVVRARVSDNISLSAGYDYLCISGVVRPGNQIDRRINPTQLVPSGAVAGPALPAARFDSSGFHAHGLSLGLSLTF
jgi:hypothetical protein